jgi:hypothetical protein
MRHPDGSSTEQRAGPSYQQAIRMAFPYFGHNLIKKISQRFKQALITGLIRS